MLYTFIHLRQITKSQSCWWTRVRAESYWRASARARTRSCWGSRPRVRSGRVSARVDPEVKKPLIDLTVKPTIELVPSLTAISLVILEIAWCLWPTADLSIGDMIIRDQSTYDAKYSPFSVHHGWFAYVCYYDWLDLPCFTAILSQKSVPPMPPWFSHDASMLISSTTTLAWLRMCDVIRSDCTYFLRTTIFIGMNIFKSGRMKGIKRSRFSRI